MICHGRPSIYPDLRNRRLRGQLSGKTVIPYQSRADIDRAPPSGKGIAVGERSGGCILRGAGSGRVKLDSGETVRVGYADQNATLIKPRRFVKWLMTPDQVSAQSIRLIRA
jgi:membrane-bound lytic murein transglycosylase A